MADASSSDLASFISQVAGDRVLRVEENLGDGFVRLRVAEAERRQAKQDIRWVEDAVVELLRNSRDAGATRIYLASWKDQTTRNLIVLDNGSGIPADKREAIFEARVTSKLESFHMDTWGVHGRGMALFSIRENADEAYVVATGEGRGSSIAVSFDTNALPERADQSSWPSLSQDEDSSYSLRGPHNIIRACCEFAIEQQGKIDLYLGSPAEIVATIHGAPTQSGESLSLRPGISLIDELAQATSALDLCDIANNLGLAMSERTAHRIVSGEIEPLTSCFDQLVPAAKHSYVKAIDLKRDPRGLKITAEDLAAFRTLIAKDFEYLAERYYLRLEGEPSVRVSGDKIHVGFTIDKSD